MNDSKRKLDLIQLTDHNNYEKNKPLDIRSLQDNHFTKISITYDDYTKKKR